MAALGIVWFRRDLRLDDNPAWARATAEHGRVLALYVLDPALLGRAGPLRTARLLGDLAALDHALADRGGRLCIRRGKPTELVPKEAVARSAAAVFANSDVTPYATGRDDAVSASLDDAGVAWQTEWGTVVHRPGSILTAAGSVSQVFTPFHRAWARTAWEPWPAPGAGVPVDDAGEGLPDRPDPYPLLDEHDGDAAEPGERGAGARLVLAAARADAYVDEHDRPDLVGTSLLSPDLRFGTVSPRLVAEAVGEGSPGREAVVRQLAWRDWFAHLLHATPTLVDRPMRATYAGLRWRDDDEGFDAWKEGRTGYPMVDAGMRQLRALGWMHNRVRMLTASFLVKNLLVDWRRGERWFRHLLIDGDVSQNVGNWQWVAGTGPDASPYNRVFNPVLQGRKFDPEGDYVRRWVPELAGLSAPALHAPWELGPLELAAAGVSLGDDYPFPIVDLAESRARALAAYASARR
ncbi:MAG TPA: deoxyribodipyrimidine photo-lyase [Acidimicrobiales bacterium]